MHSVNPNLEQELRNDPHFRIAMAEAATVVKELATTLDEAVKAPWMRRGGKQPFEVKQYDRGHEVLVVNTDYAAAITEWGGYHNPPYAPLRRAVRAAGLELKESPKDSRSHLLA